MFIRPDFLRWDDAVLRLCAAAVVLITMASKSVADVCDGNGGTVTPAFVSSPDYRSFVAGVAGSAPEVGSALGGIVKVLWQDPGPGSLFEQMKDYVNVVVPELISAEHAQMLENDAK